MITRELWLCFIPYNDIRILRQNLIQQNKSIIRDTRYKGQNVGSQWCLLERGSTVSLIIPVQSSTYVHALALWN